MARKLAAGNWKMNGLEAALSELDTIAAAIGADDMPEVAICPPFTLVAAAAERAKGNLAIGGQDCHAEAAGAHTGDVSAEMLKDAGATYVILGHSERRQDHGETDADVAAKVQAAWDAELSVILCCGESLAQREADETLDVVRRQLDGSIPEGATAENLVVAYEPIWAIGTGRVAEPPQIAEVHDAMRAALRERFGDETGKAIRLLYGGSVKAGNAAEIFATSNVDGALVGGASLKAGDFLPIVEALGAA
ncbi:triosephosphate isomerase [Roseivivax halodurans JCM 10272]|uniref:Triosephosphate isomerase n=1 Tax=Roseivivax halodurans JCM 10272 TaxID=1449350 RepID=X7EFB7_9RHOB|nr:triose-phosphate isomerase [Roseivivax halodurans]ETX14565.1 triosephosphate isomerase [Roseivivax halodurans JCM 10272]